MIKYLLLLLVCVLPEIMHAGYSPLAFCPGNPDRIQSARFKISTNVVSPFLEFHDYPIDQEYLKIRYITSARTVSVEPEYLFTDYFSVGVPVYIGVTKMKLSEISPYLHTSWIYVDSVSVPTLEYARANMERRLDLIAQFGVQGKFIAGESKRKRVRKKVTHFLPFMVFGFHAAVYDIYCFDFGYSWSTAALEDLRTFDWNEKEIPMLEVKPFRTGVFRVEGLLGFEWKFSPHFGLSFSTGFSTPRRYSKSAVDRLYSGLEGQEQVLVREVTFPGNRSFEELHGMFINRIHVVCFF